MINNMTTPVNANITVKSNTVVNYADGIDLSNFNTSLVPDNTLQLDIQNNNLTCGQECIQLEGVYKFHIVDNNTLTIVPDVNPINANITIATPGATLANSPFGIDFISTNSLGLPV